MNIYFEQRNEILRLSVNPEAITVVRENDNKEVNILAIGEVRIPGKTKLARIDIESQFWHIKKGDGMKAPAPSMNWLRKAASNRTPLRFVAGKFVNMLVLIDNFENTIKAGEERDRYYKISLVQYKPIKSVIMKNKNPANSGKKNAKPRKSPNPTLNTLKKGMWVWFKGGNHSHVSARKDFRGGIRASGKAKITQNIQPASKPYPIHLIGTGNRRVYGWVSLGQVSFLATAKAKAAPPTPAKVANKNVPTIYTTKTGDTLTSITRKIGTKGADWKVLYNFSNNKKIIGSNTNNLKAGLKLTVPTAWRR